MESSKEAVEILPEVTDKGEDNKHHHASHKKKTDKHTFTTFVCLIVFFVSLAGVAIYAVSRGHPAQLIQPSNSAGEVCGLGNQTDRPNLLYFDLARCAGLSAAVSGCPTPQVCVKECPRSYWTFTQGKSSGLGQFCEAGTNMTSTLAQLVEERACPAYLLPNTPVLGRCVPLTALGRRMEAGREEVKLNAIKTEEEEILNVDNVIGGIEYVMASIDNRGHGKKLLAYLFSCWGIILCSFLLALVLSLTWTVLIKLAVKPVLWISLALCPTTLLAATVCSLIRYSQLRPGMDDTSLSPVITSLSSYSYNRISWLVCTIINGVIMMIIFLLLIFNIKKINVAIKLFEEVTKNVTVSSMKNVLLFPVAQSLVQVIIISLFAIVASFLATSGSPEYRVVNACSFEIFTNPVTNKMFALNDLCDPRTFLESTGCPKAQCVYHKLGASALASWLQVWNLAGTIWLLIFVQSFGHMVVAEWYRTVGRAGDLSSVGIWTSFKRTCRYHLGTLACGSVLPVMCCIKSGCNEITAMTGNRICGADKMRMTNFLLFTVKLLIVEIVAATTIAASSAQGASSPDIHLNYSLAPIFILIPGAFCIASAFFSLYSVSVSTLVFGRKRTILAQGVT